VLSFSLAVAIALVAAQGAAATFHLVSIREVYPGSVAAPDSSYVELQMYAGGQNHVATHAVNLYNAAGTQIGSAFSFPNSLTPPAEGVNQETMLIGDSGVQAAFGVAPDLMSASFNVPAAGGAACWDAIDCVAWGNYTGVGHTVGTPVDGSGIPDGMAIRRKITGGTCTNLLDGADDTNNSASDFVDATPAPVSYATVPSPPSCAPVSPPPMTVIDTKPPASTSATSATFTFHSSPVGAGFECRIDAEGFSDCDSGAATYAGPLSVAGHTFQVKATDANGTGPVTSYSWTIDQTAPSVTIDNPKPTTPNPGTDITFKYHSSETGSTFECSLAKEAAADAFSSCLSTGKTLPKITENGNYVFKVLAIDQALNKGSPVSFPFTVDTSLADTTPPIATITGKPSDPSNSSTATFTYSSNEAGSTFACKLDAGAFVPCDAGGITYNGLGEGPHSFQVQATDTSANTGNPAGYSFSVVLPVTLPVTLPGPSVKPAPPAPIAPETTITTRPKAKTADRTPTFKFKSSVAGATYECKLDGKALTPCRSPLTTKALAFGRHTLKVAAIAAGLKDATPASSSFKVVRPK
jgi:hypothetical protein